MKTAASERSPRSVSGFRRRLPSACIRMPLLVLATAILCPSLVEALAASKPGKSLAQISLGAGESALRQVQWLGSRVAQKEQDFERERSQREKEMQTDGNAQEVGGSVIDIVQTGPFSSQRRQILEYQQFIAEQRSALPYKRQKSGSETKERQVWEALANLEQDSTLYVGGMYRLHHRVAVLLTIFDIY
jgi:hypothetical protein